MRRGKRRGVAPVLVVVLLGREYNRTVKLASGIPTEALHTGLENEEFG